MRALAGRGRLDREMRYSRPYPDTWDSKMKPSCLALAILSFGLAGAANAAPRERAPEATRPVAASPCPPGFSVLQDNSTCVRISGRVRADTVIGSPRSRTSDSLQTRAGGRVQLDVRKQTEYGPFRAVIRAEGMR